MPSALSFRLRGIDARVVHEHVERLVACAQLLRAGADLVERGEVGDDGGDVRVAALGGDVVTRRGEQSLVATEEHDGGAEPGEAERGRLAEAAARAGDETHAAAACRCRRSTPRASRSAATSRSTGESPGPPYRDKLTVRVRRASGGM